MSALVIVTVKCEMCPRHLDVRLPEALVTGVELDAVIYEMMSEVNVGKAGWRRGEAGGKKFDLCPDHS